MPSPVPVTRLLPRDLFPSVDLRTCSSPLSKPGTGTGSGSWLQVPARPNRGRVARRCWASVIQWEELSALQPVGAGGFGSVYRVRYRGETVALKRVKKCAKNQLASRQSFWAELNAAHLRHRNVVRVLAATTCAPPEEERGGGALGTILMEFAGEQNLEQRIYGAEEPLHRDRALRYAVHVLTGLRFLHAHGVLHLDIKPANVLVSEQDVCKIVDFGCSVKLDRTEPSPNRSPAGGTYTHRAPELLKGEAVTDKVRGGFPLFFSVRFKHQTMENYQVSD